MRICLLAVTLAGLPIHGQEVKSFEVATLKLVSPLRADEQGYTSINETKGRIAYANVHAQFLIGMAYSLNDKDLTGVPGWNDDTAYDLNATFPPDSTHADVLEMLRNLLAERLALRLHSEDKQVRGYAMVVDARGSKLKRSDAVKPNGHIDTRRGALDAQGFPTGALAGILAQAIGEPVQDLTHLDGTFDFELKWAPETTDLSVAPSERPSIFVAVTEQLGLKLRPQPVPIKRWVVERLERVPKEE